MLSIEERSCGGEVKGKVWEYGSMDVLLHCTSSTSTYIHYCRSLLPNRQYCMLMMPSGLVGLSAGTADR